MKIVPNALYAGRDPDMQDETVDGETLDEQEVQDARQENTQPLKRRKELDR